MRVLLQRVSKAQVTVDGTIAGRIDTGLVALVGVHASDSLVDTHFCADKCAHLRIFADAAGRFDLSVLDVGGAILAISQFTLYGDCSNGRRPFFGSAADPAAAEQLYEAFITRLLQVHQLTVASGIFGAHMDLEIHNDGPVTILVDSPVSA
jgi:D-tyrosyl-tRNA(Tyr) deacylase